MMLEGIRKLKEEKVTESSLSEIPEVGLRELLLFVRWKLSSCIGISIFRNSPLESLLLDNFLLDRVKIGDVLLFKGFGVYLTKNVLLKTGY